MLSGLQDAVLSGFAAIRALEAELLHATEDGRLAHWRVLGARHGPRGEITVAADVWPVDPRFDPLALARRIEHDHAQLRCALFFRRSRTPAFHNRTGSDPIRRSLRKPNER